MKFYIPSIGAKASVLLFVVISLSLSTVYSSDTEISVEEQVCTGKDPNECQAREDINKSATIVDNVQDLNDDIKDEPSKPPRLFDDDDEIADDDSIKDTENYDDDDYYDDEEDDFDYDAYSHYYEEDGEEEEEEELEMNKKDEFVEEVDESCKDNHRRCNEWAELGECAKNAKYMNEHCQKSCQSCEVNYYGTKQNNPEGSETFNEVNGILEKMKEYMENEIKKNETLSYLIPKCKNRNTDCAFWATIGECDKNPAYMLTTCAPVCNTCHLLDFKVRCPIREGVVDAMKSGDVHGMFERIADKRDFGNVARTLLPENGIDLDESNFKVTILSRPDYVNGDTKETADYKIGPWVITIDNFIHEEECDKLISLGGDEGYERSEDVGEELFDGSYGSVQSKSRTSFNAWCTNDCFKHPMAKAVAARIEELTGIPEENSENLQLLRYNVGQFYRTHHDYIDNQEDFPAGPRLLTAFLYLNDVEGGGGTNFPRLDITVMPKKGRLLLWPSVVDHDPLKVDSRTFHQALPVEKGVKYAANAWLHMRDFKEPNDRNCT